MTTATARRARRRPSDVVTAPDHPLSDADADAGAAALVEAVGWDVGREVMSDLRRGLSVRSCRGNLSTLGTVPGSILDGPDVAPPWQDRGMPTPARP
jgi:hypothetical protein